MNRSHALVWQIAHAMTAAACLLLSPPLVLAQQPCNPVIDGTYCATQMPRTPAPSGPSRVQMRPIEDIGSAISVSPNSTATFGGISFGGGTTCIGLMRRGRCD